MQTKKVNEWEMAFSVGYACACAVMLQEHGEDTIVEDCFRANFMDIETMRSFGVDENDIEVLTPIVKEIERKRALLVSA